MPLVFVGVSVTFAEPRGQHHNFYVCPDVATLMASTVFCVARLAIHLHVKLFSVSGAIAAHMTAPLP